MGCADSLGRRQKEIDCDSAVVINGRVVCLDGVVSGHEGMHCGRAAGGDVIHCCALLVVGDGDLVRALRELRVIQRCSKVG